LQYMIWQWQDAMNAALPTQSQSPLIISETNFTAIDCFSPYDTIEEEGTYQLDLYTWLYDHLGYTSWAAYPIRTVWFEEMDDVSTSACGSPSTPEYLGLFGSGT